MNKEKSDGTVIILLIIAFLISIIFNIMWVIEFGIPEVSDKFMNIMFVVMISIQWIFIGIIVIKKERR